jgi:hypothetical protein
MKLSVFVLFGLGFFTTSFAQGTLIPAAGPDRTPWVEKLREEFQVEIVEDDPELFDADLMQALHAYVSVSPRTRPIHLHATKKTGARKVWVRDRANPAESGIIDLYFAKDAGKGLFSKGQRQQTLLGDGRTEIIHEYSSDLTLQLNEILYPIPELQRILLERYHIRTDCAGVSDPCDSFKKKEYLAILGILHDLPPVILQTFKLKRMIRFPDGVSNILEVNAAAVYSGDGTIRVTSRAFDEEGDRLGEGTLTHEIGHAVWYGMPSGIRESFVAISWETDPKTGEARLKGGSGNFISEYSLSKPEEDFAEHFSAFFNQPEMLNHLAPAKRAWLKERIFIDTEYFSTAAANARIHVIPETPDARAPRFTGRVDKSIEVKTEVLDQERIQLQVRLKGLRDDVSGYSHAWLTFRSDAKPGVPQVEYELEVIASECTQEKEDEYIQTRILTRSELPPGVLSLNVVRLQDRAGNWDYVFPESTAITLDLQGTASKQSLLEKSHSYENQRQKRIREAIEKNLKPLQGEVRLVPGAAAGTFILHLPKQVDRQEVDLTEVQVRFLGIRDWGVPGDPHLAWNYEQELSYQFKRKEIREGTNESGVDLFLDLRRGVNLDRMGLYAVVLSYRTLTWSLWFYPHAEIEVIELDSIGSDPTPAEIEINDIDIDLIRPNGTNEEMIIKTRIPLSGFEHGGKVRITYQTPSGKRITGSGQELKPGESVGDIEIKLDRFREGGEYLIREIEILENSPAGTNPSITQGSQYRVQKVLTRGIRKTVTIEPKLDL